MSESLRIALAQLDLLVGDVQGNAARVISTARRAHEELRAQLVLFPELALSGYPPEDLLFHRGFRRQTEEGLARLRRELTDAAVMVGFPEYTHAGIYTTVAPDGSAFASDCRGMHIFDAATGEIIGSLPKQMLAVLTGNTKDEIYGAGSADGGAASISGGGGGTSSSTTR